MTAPRATGSRSILRGYGPFIMLAVLVLGMAIFVPSKVQSVRNASVDALDVPGEVDDSGSSSDVRAPKVSPVMGCVRVFILVALSLACLS